MSSLFEATVAAHQLHVRSGPKVSFESRALLPLAAPLDIQEIDPTGTWGRINVQGVALAWVSLKYAPPMGVAAELLATAAAEIGVRENTDLSIAHPRILQYLATVDGLSSIDKSKDETAWCSCFINWCVEQRGMKGTNSASAVSWHDWRTQISLATAQPGDLVVFSRHSPTDSGGHVGFLIKTSDDGKQVLILGGNQSDSVCYAWFPLDGVKGDTRYRLLSIRQAS